MGLVSFDEWFIPLTVINDFTRKMCWYENIVWVTRRYRCPRCFKILYPFFNSKLYTHHIKIKARLYNTAHYNLIREKVFTLKRYKKLVSTIKAYSYMNKIYIIALGVKKGSKKMIFDILPLSIVRE
ncbi:MAG: hypothetical protein ACK4NF_02920 [Planctomycetota bacterium]